VNTWTPLTAAERKALREALVSPRHIAVPTWTYCAVHDHCQVEVDLNEGRGVRWCDGATWDGLPCDLRALTAGGRA